MMKITTLATGKIEYIIIYLDKKVILRLMKLVLQYIIILIKLI